MTSITDNTHAVSSALPDHNLASAGSASASNDDADDLARIYTRTLIGVNAVPVTVEVHLANGLPTFNIVGLPETAVKESKDRVRAALESSGFELPVRRITVNLSPADVPKSGSQFDLPIAIGVLVASAQLRLASPLQEEFIGELALNGDLHRVKGVLPCVWAASQAQRPSVIPSKNSTEAGLVKDAICFGARSLLAVCKHLAEVDRLPQITTTRLSAVYTQYADLAEVKGQPHAKRALEIAAAGKHNMLMIGPPGAGKSMLAQRLPSILPPFSPDEALVSAAVRSIVEGEFHLEDWAKRPFRSPHHSCSAVALIGGGSVPRPGEVSQAHGGVLFLDEITEFSRHALEQLREPLETGYIHIARANQSVCFPAACQLLAACNPCRCGYFGDESNRCQCSAASLQAYQSKLSGPLMDRIDLHLKLSAVKLHALQEAAPACESSSEVRARVVAARAAQITRQGCLNSELSTQKVDAVLNLNDHDANFLVTACEKLQLSARGFYRVKKIARTIADLDVKPSSTKPLGSTTTPASTTAVAEVGRVHLAEALSYRSL